MRLDKEKKSGWLKLKNKALHSGRMSGHDGTEEDVDGDWVDKDNAALGEGGGGLGRKTKAAAVSEDGGNPTQIPKEAFFYNRRSCVQGEGTPDNAVRIKGATSPWFTGQGSYLLMVKVSLILVGLL